LNVNLIAHISTRSFGFCSAIILETVRNRSSETTIVVDEGVPVDPTYAVTYCCSLDRSTAAASNASQAQSFSLRSGHASFVVHFTRSCSARVQSRQFGLKLMSKTLAGMMVAVALQSVVSLAGGYASASSRARARSDSGQAGLVRAFRFEFDVSGWVKGRIVRVDAARAIEGGSGDHAAEHRSDCQ
jgi:hypothetical protein